MDKIVIPTIRVVNLREKDLQFKMHYRYNTILLNKYLKNLTATVMGFCNGKPEIKRMISRVFTAEIVCIFLIFDCRYFLASN